MNISRLFVLAQAGGDLAPAPTSLLMIALVLVGLVAVRFLPISSLPSVDYPTIQIFRTFYPGASPTVMRPPSARHAARGAIGRNHGVQQMTSSRLRRCIDHPPCTSRSGAELDVAEQNVRKPSTQPAACCRPVCRHRPRMQGESRRPAILAWSPGSMASSLQDRSSQRRAEPRCPEVQGVGLVTPAGGGNGTTAVIGEVHYNSRLRPPGIDDLRSVIASNPRSRQPAEEEPSTGFGSFTRSTLDQSRSRGLLNTVISYQNGAPVPDTRDVARSPRRRRTPNKAPGTTARRPMCSTCSASPVRM